MSVGVFSFLGRLNKAKVALLVGVILAFVGVLFVALARAQAEPLDVRINFQPEAMNGSTPVLSGGTPVPAPAGYTKDVGQGYDDARGYGWVRQDSLGSATHEPLSVVPNARDRNKNTRDQRLDTLIHMQFPPASTSTTAVKTPAAWEYALPNGSYLVTVAVGEAQAGADAENHAINVEGVSAISNFPNLPNSGTTLDGSDARHRTATVRADVTDGRLTIDAIGGTNTKINYVDIRDVPATDGFGLKVNFQSDLAPVPAGYVRDFGEAYGARGATGLEYGWVTPGTSTPLSLVGNGRDRNVAADVSAGLDQRLDTLVHMQANSIPGTFNGIKAEGAWEVAVPDGSYDVAISAGDPSPGSDATTHRINVEGENVISDYPVSSTTSGAARFTSGTASVDVTDGRLTVDASGGTNTKINFIDLTRTGDADPPADTTAPDAPTGLASKAGDGEVGLVWDASSAGDLAGYNVYRDGAAQPLNGSLLSATSYADGGLTNGTEYTYEVTAVDAAGNESTRATVKATPRADGAPDVESPSAPGNVRATGGEDRIDLAWDAATDNVGVAGYIVYEGETKLNDAPIEGLSFAHTGLGGDEEHSYVVEAVDAAGNAARATAVTARTLKAVECPQGVCAEKAVALPFEAGFGGDQKGVHDKDREGTGFRLVQASSNGGAYLPENLDVTGGQLKITTTPGIQYKTDNGVGPKENALDNGLGVRFDAAAKTTRISIDVINPPGGTNSSQQAGLWFGPDEDNYAKLVVGSGGANASTTNQHKVQVVREINGASALSTNPALTDEINGAAADWRASTIHLVLDVAAGGKATASYAVGSGAEQRLGELTVPASWFTSAGEAGVFATKRNNTEAGDKVYTLDDFSMEELDTTAPAAPRDLAANAGDGTVALSWTANDENDLAGYFVYRDGEKLNQTARSGTSYTDEGLANGTEYTYAVSAIDAAGNESERVTGKATPRAAAPTNRPPTVTDPGDQSGREGDGVSLQIAAEDPDAGDALSYGATGLPAGLSIDQNSGLISGTIGDGAAPDSPYAVTVTATDNGNPAESASAQFSWTVSERSDTTAPATPTGLEATPSSAGIALDWNDNTEPDLAGYNVYRADSPDGPFEKLNANGPLTTSAYDDATAPEGAVSYYQVRAVDAAGNESAPRTDSATRPAPDTAPDAPTGLAATPSAGGIVLDWNDNVEQDLAGYNVYRSPQPGGAAGANFVKINASLLTGSRYDDADAPAGDDSYYRVTAVDAAGNESGPATDSAFRPAGAPACDPRSTLPCDQVKASGPVALEFSGDEGKLADKDGQGIGFTMVDPPSSRLAADDPVSNPAVPGYEPSKLDVSGGKLAISSTKGIMYRTNGTATTQTTDTNSQINALGVGLDAAGKTVHVGTTLAKPAFPATANSEQAGLWFGLNEDNYAKLVLVNMGNGTAKVQLAREVGALSTGPASGQLVSVDEVNTANATVANGTAVRLVLKATAPTAGQTTGTLTGTYQIGSGAEQTLQPLNLPAGFFEGTQVSASGVEKATFAGVSATHRRGSTPINAAFENFSVTSEAPPADTTAPAAPQNVRATGGDGKVDLAWDANTEADLDGYNVYRGTSESVDTSGPPLNGSLLKQANYTDPSAQNGTAYHYVVQAVDTSANKSGASARVSATPRAATGGQQFAAKINFQNAAGAVPGGYLRDYGQGYGARSGANQGTGLVYGWVTPGTSTPVDLSTGGTQNLGNGRDRNTAQADQRLDTLMHMQAGSSTYATPFNGKTADGAWEISVPNGTYEVTVAAGDPAVNSDPERHTINVEGVNAIRDFVPSGSAGADSRHQTRTVTVAVNDGRLTIDATGGTNSKINYVDLASIETGPDTTPPAVPVNAQARAGDARVTVTWDENPEPDIDGYNVYLGSSAQGTPLNGGTLIANGYFIDRNLTNGTERTYVVEAVDTSGNRSVTQPVSATPRADATDDRPKVSGAIPPEGATGVPLRGNISAQLSLVAEGVDEGTFSSETVKLIKVSDGSQVSSSYGTSGGNDVINAIPNTKLEPNTRYRFEVTDGVKDLNGIPFVPFSSTFTTGTSDVFTPPGVTKLDLPGVSFQRVAQTTPNKTYTSVTFGPDGKLYAGTTIGEIYRFDVGADGTLSNATLIDTVRQNNNANGGQGDCNTSTVGNNGCTKNRLIIGMTFEPGSTAENPKLWVTHSTFGFGNMKDWGGKLSVLSGQNLGDYRDVLVNLPRSSKDHLTNSVAFKDGKIYIPVGATTAMGAYDQSWKGTERLLSAAVIEVDYQSIQGTLDAKTIDGGGTYDPYAPGAPVKIYATGVRNAVDLVWHSNGHLYAPTNGSAGGSNVPATPDNFQNLPQCQRRGYTGPAVPDFDGANEGVGAARVPTTQLDYLFDVVRGGYYGNPNPSRCEWVLNLGDPTTKRAMSGAGVGEAAGEVDEYPDGTLADPNYRGWAYNFINNKSPNGAIEYKGNNFGGKLEGKLIVARYTTDDIIVLEPGANGDIAKDNAEVPGFTKVPGSEDPLDLIEDPKSGNIYVTEGVKNPPDGTGKITLLKAADAGTPRPADVKTDKDRLVFNDVQNGAASASQTVTVRNAGGENLTISGVGLSGSGANQFQITSGPAGSVTLTPGQTQQIGVAFNPTSVGPKGASLDIATNDPDTATQKVNLRGLGTLGLSGSNEPSLQWILDTYEIPVNVGDPDKTDNSMPATASAIGDEIAGVQRMQAAYSDAPVTVEPLAVFGPQHTGGTVTKVGRYVPGSTTQKSELFTVPNSGYQSLNPNAQGSFNFETPDSFGLYSIWPFFNDREVYSEDDLNTWEPTAANRHKVRVYPLKKADGSVEQNAYIVATEEHTSGYDYQDAVYIIRNAKPAGADAPEVDASEPNELVFSGVKGSQNLPAQTVTVKNSGKGTLEVSGAGITGTNAGAFQLVNPPSFPLSVPSNETATFSVKFVPGSTQVGSLSAKLALQTNDADEANVDVGLYGLSTNGEQGGNEPTLQDVVNTLGHPVRVHDLSGNPLTYGTDSNLKGEEVRAPLFQKAGSGNVTIKPVARYSPDEVLPFGYYTYPEGNLTENVVATIDLDQEQTLNPKIQAGGGDSFDPGSEKFGIFVDSKSFNRKSYQQDNLNTGSVAHAVRVYPAKNRAGGTIADTYLVTFEDAANGDYQDYVFRVTNARPAQANTGTGASGKINFQPAQADATGRPSGTGTVVEVPSGYTRDIGQGFDATRGFGWIDAASKAPVDMTAHTRLRTGPADQRLKTLILAQGAGGLDAKANSAWEYSLPNGTYEVSLSVGDDGFTDSVHRVNVEGVNAINNFAPTTATKFASNTVTVAVTDGRLTLDFGGSASSYNTKLNYVDIQSVSGTTPETATGNAQAGNVVTTDNENGGNGASPADPVETTVTVPGSVNSGSISINEKAITQSAPSGYLFFGQQVDLAGPAATAASPYPVLFEIDPSTLPTGANETNVQAFKDGTLVQNCATDAGESASPNPCVLKREKAANGDILVTVRTASFGAWNFGVSGSAQDTTLPKVDVAVGGTKLASGAYKGKAVVTIDASDAGGSGLDKTFYSLDGGVFKAYTAQFDEAKDAYTYKLDVTTEGNHTIRARAIDGAGNTTTTTEQGFSVAASKAEIELENGDGGAVSSTVTAPGVPFPDRLVMSRIQNPEDGTGAVPKNYVHDVSTLRVKNTGADPLDVTNAQINGPFALENPPAFPATVPAGGSLDIKVRFTATSGSVHNGTLTISSDDADEPTLPVELSGFWQSVSEGGQEPDNVEINRVLGYGTTILYPGQQLNSRGKLTTIGDEVISPYWQRANATKPVGVRQLAAYHTQGNTATFYWHAKGSNTTAGVLTHLGVDGQTLLPRRNNQNADTGTIPAYAEFTPSAATFGFKIDPEWSDWTKNNSQVDVDNGCTGTCGHHMRFWPVRDRAGKIVPNQYLVGMDYSGINYDFNDNVYLVTNIKPENPAANPANPAPLPGSPSLNLGFDKDYPNTLEDKDGAAAGYQTGTGTGFSSTQRNENDQTDGSDSYKPDLLDIDTAAGTLAVRTFGTDTTGSNGGQDNTLVNGLQTPFDGSSGRFVVGTKLNGPLNLTAGSQQGGVMFGPDQDNFAKLVAINTNGSPTIEFFAEQNATGATQGTKVAIPNPGSVTSLELFLIADPQDGTVKAAYRINGGAIETLPNTVTLTGAQVGRFFSEQAKAGIITQHKGGTETTITFDNFSVTEQIPGATPEPEREALYRLDVAGSGNYTDAKGNVWRPDTGFFAPATAPNEGANVQPQEIANTDEDAIYRTYRGNVGNVPQDQRVLTYNLPTRGAEQLDLRLHFAERAGANNAAGKRLFDIEAEGKLLRDDFDIFAAAGGQNTAIALPLNNVAVKDGNLTLALKASADYPAIAGIEVLCEGACPAVDLTPPAAPTGLAATASDAGVALDWANNAETDLAGYNVYRATSASGAYAKVNDALITASQYTDAQAPAGAASYYQVRAVDASGNESDASAAVNATRPAADIRINAGGTQQTVNGTVWKACSSLTNCSGYVTGGGAYSEADTNTGIPANMNNAIFQSEWTGGQASGVPVGGTAFTFNVPVQNGAYNVRLHFAELNKNAANLRLFDVNIEGGAKELTNFDVFAEAGGINKAVVREFPATVTDGNATIQFITVKENAKVSAIEVLPVPPDNQAPAAPTGLTATASNGVALDWANNAESDLAGYNVYRSATENGTYTKLNGAPLTASEYKDADASGPGTFFYQVKAVDKSANESGAAAASRELSAPSGFTQITWDRGAGDNSPAPQPFSNSEGQSEVVGGKLYSFGGFDAQKACCTPTKRAYVYNPATDNWTAIADMPFTPTGANFGGTTHTGIANDGTNIFMAGGYTSNAAGTGQTFGTKQVWRYNVAANNYTKLPDLPVERAAGQLEYLNGKLHYFGGTNLARTQDVGDHYVLDLAGNATAWTTAAPLPNPRHHLAAVALNGKIYALGGQHGHDGTLTPQADVHVYDPATNRWSDVKDLPKAINHAGASTFVMDGRIIVVGGQLNHGVSVADVSAYDPQANAWTPLTPLPVSRHSAVAGTINGDIYFSTGGSNETMKGTTALSAPAAPSITGPAEGSFDADGNVTVSGTAPANSAVELFEGSNSVGTTTASSNGDWSIALTGVADGSHTYTAKATVSGKTSGASNARTVVVDKAAPTVTARSPQANATAVALGANVTATFSEEMDAATVTASTFKLSEQGGAGVAAAVNYDAASKTATLNPSADLKASTTYAVTVDGVKDRAGNALAAEGWTFTTKAPEAQAPIRINAGGPAVTTGGVAWEADRNFSGGKTYTNPSVTAIAGTTDDALYLNERSATADLGTFGYAIPVTESGTYTVKLHFAELYWGATGGGAGGAGKRVFSANLEGGATELQDLDLNAVAGPMTAVTRSFDTPVNDGTLNITFSASTNQPTVSAIEVSRSTTPPPDTTSPTVTGNTPAANATAVALGANVTATFSEEMKASTITASTFKLSEQGGADVAAAVSYEAASKTATLDPGADLKPNTTYVATVTAGAQDAAGNALAEARTWSFTTRQPVVTPPAAPTVDLAAASDTGVSSTDDLTNDATPTFNGQAAAGSTVEVFDGSASLGTATASNAGAYSLTVADAAKLSEGPHTITAKATLSGATSPASGPLAVTVDTAAPDTTLASSGPSGTVSATSATFEFTSEGNTSFECKLDAGAWEPNCASPKGYSNLSTGGHTFSVRATDRAGNTDASPAGRSWTISGTPAQKTALLVTGSATLNPADNAIRQELVKMGYTVTVESAFATSASSASGKSVVLVSSTVTGSTVGTKFRNVAVPVVTWEVAQLAPQYLGLTAANNSGRETGQTQVNVVGAGHPLAGGLTNGNKPVLTSGSTQMTWGAPTASADKIATVVGQPSKSVIFGYEKGDQMSGLTAPARRVGFYLHDTTATTSNANGWTLFRAAVGWAAGVGGGTTTPPTEPTREAVRIDAGGPGQTVGGVGWRACSSVSNCSGYLTGGFQFGNNNAISGVQAPANQAIYQTEWTGGQTNGVPAGGTAFRFDVPVQDGSYNIRLHFAEIAQNAIGKRVFDVNIEGGAKELAGFDLFAEAGGMNRAFVREFPTSVTDGSVSIEFIRQVENAKVSGIEIIPVADNSGQQAIQSTLSLDANRSTLTFGQTATLSGTLSTTENEELANRRVVLEERPAGNGPFAPVDVSTTNANGAFDFPVQPQKNPDYRVRFAGDGEAEPSSSPSESIEVGALVTSDVSSGTVKSGRQVIVSGKVLPASEGQEIEVTIRRGSRIVAVKRLKLDANSAYSFAYKTGASGTYSVVASYAGDADNLGGDSRAANFKVTG